MSFETIKELMNITQIKEDEDAQDTTTDEVNNSDVVPTEADRVVMDMPLFIRALEFAREDAKDDVDLHNFAEKALVLLQDKEVLDMSDYDYLIQDAEKEVPSDEDNEDVEANEDTEANNEEE